MIGRQLIRISSSANVADNIVAAIDGFLVYCRSKNLSENTIIYYRNRLAAFQRFLSQCSTSSAPKDVTRNQIREFVQFEIQEHSPSTANHSITTLRAFFNYLVSEEFLDTNPMDGVSKVRQKKPLIETFSTDQVEAIIESCSKTFVGIRDKAIVLVLFDCGLRASELCGLSLKDIDWKEQTLTVLGKGDKERIVSFGQSTRQALASYISRRPDLPTEAFFVTCYGQQLDRYRLREIIKYRCGHAGISGVRCSPHTFRHTFAVTYLRAGGDVFSLQKLLGHSDLTMTRRYCELSQTDALNKHRMFSPGDRLQSIKPTRGRKRIV